MPNTETIYAFIDGQNLNLGVRSQGWILDLKKFWVYLRDKYQVDKVFYFIGYVKSNKPLYQFLKRSGYTLIFKPVLISKRSNKLTLKGNVDAEIVLYSLIEINNYDKAILISGDGDFYCLIKYLIKKQKFTKLVIPNRNKYSALLREFICYIDYLNGLKDKLRYKKRGINLRTKP